MFYIIRGKKLKNSKYFSFNKKIKTKITLKYICIKSSDDQPLNDHIFPKLRKAVSKTKNSITL